ncbi:MAG: hypothetical protein HOV92_12460 [Streptomyces sp.]|nr:hypothetical protein [Streptomyces sp.]
MTFEVGTRLAALEKKVERLTRGSKLAAASLENTAVQVYDGSGILRGVIGMQPDGTIGLVAQDGPAPGAPTPPTVTPSIGGLRVVWDGTLADGTTLPADFDHVAVHMSTTSGFTPSAATFVGTITRAGDGGMLPVTPLPYVPHYVVLTAVNSSGIAGVPSAETAATPLKVDGIDLTAGSVTASTIAAGAVTAEKLEAVLELATRLVAGDPAGARVELNEDGLRVYDALGVLVIRFDSADGSAVFTGDITGSDITGSTITTGTTGMPQVRVGTLSGTGYIEFPTNRPLENDLSRLLTGVVNSGLANEYASLQLQGPSVDGATDRCVILINSQTNDGTANASMDLRAGTGRITYDKALLLVDGPRLSLTPDPSSSAALDVLADASHTGNMLRASLGSTTYLQLTADGRLQILSTASSSSSLFINAASGHTGNLIRAQLNSVDKFLVDGSGNATVAGNASITGNAAVTGNLTVTGIGSRTTKRRTSDATKTSTVTLAADSQITFPVDANAVYALDGFLKYSGPGDFQMGWSFPTGTLGEWQGIGNGTTVVGYASGAIQTDTSGTFGYMVRTESTDLASPRTYGGISTNVYGVQVRALIRVGATAGTLALTWAQGTSNATATTLYTDSHLRLEKVA